MNSIPKLQEIVSLVEFTWLGCIKIPFLILGFNQPGHQRRQQSFLMRVTHHGGGASSISLFKLYLNSGQWEDPTWLKMNELLSKHNLFVTVGLLFCKREGSWLTKQVNLVASLLSQTFFFSRVDVDPVSREMVPTCVSLAKQIFLCGPWVVAWRHRLVLFSPQYHGVQKAHGSVDN